MAERRRINPDVAASARRAAALYAHWSQKSGDGTGESAIFQEMKSDEDWVHLVCALLHFTDGLVKAARDGREDWYAAFVLREAMLDEVGDG